MRVFLIAACIMLGVGPAQADPYPSSVTYHLGGAMSGPYRIAADLAGGTVTEARTPPGKFGDGAGLRTSELPVTAGRVMTPRERKALRRAADEVWRKGATISIDDVEEVKPADDSIQAQGRAWAKEYRAARLKESRSCYTVDALGRFEIVKNGRTKTYDFSTPCMNAAAKKLLRLMVCVVHPENADCSRN